MAYRASEMVYTIFYEQYFQYQKLLIFCIQLEFLRYKMQNYPHTCSKTLHCDYIHFKTWNKTHSADGLHIRYATKNEGKRVHGLFSSCSSVQFLFLLFWNFLDEHFLLLDKTLFLLNLMGSTFFNKGLQKAHCDISLLRGMSIGRN